MNLANKIAFLFMMILLVTRLDCFGSEVIISTNNPSGNQGSEVGFPSSGAIFFDTNNLGTAEVVIDPNDGNLDAFHVRNNGNLLLSTQTTWTLGGIEFADGEIAEFNLETQEATSFLNFENILDDAFDIDIDSISETTDGRVVFSTLGDSAIGIGPNAGLAFTKNDIMAFNPVDSSAEIIFSADLITDGDRFNNVSGVSVMDDGKIGIAVGTGDVVDISLGGLTFQRNDAVLYDTNSGIAQILIEGSSVFVGPPNPGVDALHVVRAEVVPEPSSCVLAFTALLALALAKKDGNSSHGNSLTIALFTTRDLIFAG